jgi:hypothetical protein
MKPDTEAAVVSLFAEIVSEKTEEISTLLEEKRKIRSQYFLKDMPKNVSYRFESLSHIIEKKQNEVRKFLSLLNRIQDDSRPDNWPEN